MRPIDPIVVKEQGSKLDAQLRIVGLAKQAATALTWFHDYAIDRTKGIVPAPARDNAIDAQNRLSEAQSVAGGKEAQAYISRAAVEFRGEIVERAIEMAQADFDAANKKDT